MELIIEYRDHSNAIVSTYRPIQLNYKYNLNAPGECSWAIALNQKQVNGTPLTQDEFAPKRNDYLLRTASGLKLQAGRLLDVKLDSDEGIIRCAGQDWLEYLNQPPLFDYSLNIETLGDNVDNVFMYFTPTAGTDTNSIFYNSTQQKIIQTILNRASVLSDIAYTANFAGTGWSTALSYYIPYLDESSMLAHIQAMSAYSEPRGFDFWCDWDKTIYFHAPRFVNPSSVVTLFDLQHGLDPPDPFTKVSWHDTGPLETRTVGKNSINFWKERFYAPSISTFRDELRIVDLGQKYDYGSSVADIQLNVDKATDAEGSKDWNPQKDLALTVIPTKLFPNENAGFLSMVGEACSFNSNTMFMPFHQINATYYIVSQEYTDVGGGYLLELGLQQIYST